MIDNPNFDLTHLNRLTMRLANKDKNKSGTKWLFDFDSSDKDLLNQFLSDLSEYVPRDEIEVSPTVSGYAVITPRGFNKTLLMPKYSKYVEFKGDAQKLIAYKAKQTK